MNAKRFLFILFAIPVVAMAALTIAADRSQLIGGGAIDPTCTSSSPCIEYDNNGTGPGIKGVALGEGNGVSGVTKWNSTNSTNARVGVIGADISTASDGSNFGVKGTSGIGTGVEGISSGGIGVRALSTGGLGLYAFSSTNEGAAIENNDPSSNTLEILADNLSTSPFAIYQKSPFATLMTLDSGGNLSISGKLFTSGPCSSGCTLGGKHVISYAPHESQPSMEDSGEARLVNGQAYVPLDGAFANVIDQRTTYLVFITPEGDSNGLYVTQKTALGFAVHENRGGRSTLAFSYRIVAKPYGDQSPRLPMVDARIRPRPILPVH